jgi:thiosulfate reductase cytochrome b subunit
MSPRCFVAANASVPMPDSEIRYVQRHSAVVRVTHWINAAGFLALVVSGTAILLAYPRLHWGETGSLGTPSLVDLPLPFVLELGIRGPGRYLHFLSAWVLLFNGSVYLISGLYTRHFRNDLLPRRSDLALRPMLKVIVNHLQGVRDDEIESYNVLQRLFYLGVIFVLIPFMFVSGLAMSPAVTSVVPALVEMLGGHQSARTLHFVAANLLLLFFLIHMTMLFLTGFTNRCRAMITGYLAFRRKT